MVAILFSLSAHFVLYREAPRSRLITFAPKNFLFLVCFIRQQLIYLYFLQVGVVAYGSPCACGLVVETSRKYSFGEVNARID